MKKQTIQLSVDLIWGIQREARVQNKSIDIFVRELYEFWKKSSQNALNHKIKGEVKNA